MRGRLAAAALAVALGAVALTGCSMGDSAEDGMSVWGYVASADSAQLEVDEVQPGGGEITVSRVASPGAAWIVVHADDDGAPGERVGLAHIDAGETQAVRVELEGAPTAKLFVAVHADRGTPNEFDFDMMNKEMSPDRPYFVDGEELARVVEVQAR